MITFRNIRMNGIDMQMQELTFSQAIQVSNTKGDEHQLTEFLNHALNVDALALNVHQRYYFLLRYLEQQQSELLGTFPHGNYCPQYAEFESIEIVHDVQDGHEHLRQLTGYDLHLLEDVCQDFYMWFLNAIALQYSNSEIDILAKPLDPTQNDYQDKYYERISYLANLPMSEVDVICSRYIELSSQLQGLNMNIAFSDNGIALQGGDGDMPMRFHSTTALGQLFNMA